MLLGKKAGKGADSLEKPIIQLVLDETGYTLAFGESVSRKVSQTDG